MDLVRKKLKKGMLKILTGVALFATLAACGGGSGSTASTPSTPSTQTGYTLKAGETIASDLSLSMIENKTFYWAQEGIQYGSIGFYGTAGSGTGTGIFSESAPTPSSSSTTWNAVAFAGAMPTIVSDGSSITTFNIIATASNYYVLARVIANTPGTQYMRWYFGTGAQTAAASFAGNPAVPTVNAFKTADFSGKSMYWVGGTSYQLCVFSANGVLQLSIPVTSGVPVIGTGIYTWQIVDGVLQVVTVGVSTVSTATYTYNATVPMSIPLSDAAYYRVIRDNGATQAIVYATDPTKALAAAQALAIAGGP